MSDSTYFVNGATKECVDDLLQGSNADLWEVWYELQNNRNGDAERPHVVKVKAHADRRSGKATGKS